MYLKPVVIDIWKIYTIKRDRGECPLLDFLNSLGKNYEENVDALLADLETIAERAGVPHSLFSPKKCHQIADGIWQLTVGRLRLAWFYDEGKILICAHAFFKDTPKTKKSDKTHAIDMKDKYFSAKKKNNLVFEKDEKKK